MWLYAKSRRRQAALVVLFESVDDLDQAAVLDVFCRVAALEVQGGVTVLDGECAVHIQRASIGGAAVE